MASTAMFVCQRLNPHKLGMLGYMGPLYLPPYSLIRWNCPPWGLECSRFNCGFEHVINIVDVFSFKYLLRPFKKPSQWVKVPNHHGYIGYPLVNVFITENHHFEWENQLFQWPFSIAMLVYQRVKL